MSDSRPKGVGTLVEPSAPQAAPAPKRPYQPPHLIVYGDLRDLTMGPSTGSGESGNPTIFRA